MIDYDYRINSITKRYNPDGVPIVERRMFDELGEDERSACKYVRQAMKKVDDSYTSKIVQAGNALKNQLSKSLYNVTFEVQGSVKTGTHIMDKSDIDILVMTDLFQYTEINKIRSAIKPPCYLPLAQKNNLQIYSDTFSAYTGDTVEVLRRNRLQAETIISTHYKYYDLSNKKSIKVKPTQFNREVDVVIGSWFDSMEYVKDNDKRFRGVSIYDKELNKILPYDYPFLSISRINQRNSNTDGRLCQMIRFLKNVRSDSNISLNSFEINAICYDIPAEEYKDMGYKDMVNLLWLKMYNILNDDLSIDTLLSVDKSEYVFKDKPDKVANLRRLKDDVWTIYNAIK